MGTGSNPIWDGMVNTLLKEDAVPVIVGFDVDVEWDITTREEVITIKPTKYIAQTIISYLKKKHGLGSNEVRARIRVLPAEWVIKSVPITHYDLGIEE